MADHGLLSFRRTEMFWNTKEMLGNTKRNWVLLIFSWVCQNISYCLKSNAPQWRPLPIVFREFRLMRLLDSSQPCSKGVFYTKTHLRAYSFGISKSSEFWKGQTSETSTTRNQKNENSENSRATNEGYFHWLKTGNDISVVRYSNCSRSTGSLFRAYSFGTFCFQ